MRAINSCPYCQSFSKVTHKRDADGDYYIECASCGLRGPRFTESDAPSGADLALSAWNRMSEIADKGRASEGNQTYPYRFETMTSSTDLEGSYVESGEDLEEYESFELLVKSNERLTRIAEDLMIELKRAVE